MRRFIGTIALALVAAAVVHSRAIAQWQRLSGPYEGDIGSIAIDSNGRLFASTAWEIYRSLDSARTWHRLDRPDVPAATIDLWTTPDGSVLALIDSAKLGRLFRSTDGGATWSPSDQGMPPFYFRGAGRFATDRATRAIYLALGDGIYRSADDGASWRRIAQLAATEIGAGGGNLFGMVDGRLYRMSSAAGFDTVRVVPHWPMEIRSFVVDDAGTLIAALTAPNAHDVAATTDDGATWRELDHSFHTTGALRLFLHPDDGFVALSDSLDIRVGEGALWRTRSYVSPYFIGELRIAPAGTIYAASRRGVLRSDDSGATWRSANDGINAAYVRSLHANGDTLLAATMSGSYWSGDDGNSWRRIEERLESVLWDPVVALDPDGTIVSTVPHTDRMTYRRYMTLRTSTDAGATWTECAPLDRYEQHVVWKLHAVRGTIAALTQTGEVYASTNRGAAWTELRSPAGQTIASIAIDSAGAIVATDGYGVYRATAPAFDWGPARSVDMVRDIYAAPNDELYVTGLRGIFRSRGAEAFVRLGAPALFAARPIAIDGEGGITAGGADVVRSTDDGATWRRFDDGIDRSSAITITRGSGRRLYAGVYEAGIYACEVDERASAPSVARRSSTCGAIASFSASSSAIAIELRGGARVRLAIHDMLGREIARVHDGRLASGAHRMTWRGLQVGSYILSVAADGCREAMPIVVR